MVPLAHLTPPTHSDTDTDPGPPVAHRALRALPTALLPANLPSPPLLDHYPQMPFCFSYPYLIHWFPSTAPPQGPLARITEDESPRYPSDPHAHGHGHGPAHGMQQDLHHGTRAPAHPYPHPHHAGPQPYPQPYPHPQQPQRPAPARQPRQQTLLPFPVIGGTAYDTQYDTRKPPRHVPAPTPRGNPTGSPAPPSEEDVSISSDEMYRSVASLARFTEHPAAAAAAADSNQTIVTGPPTSHFLAAAGRRPRPPGVPPLHLVPRGGPEAALAYEYGNGGDGEDGGDGDGSEDGSASDNSSLESAFVASCLTAARNSLDIRKPLMAAAAAPGSTPAHRGGGGGVRDVRQGGADGGGGGGGGGKGMSRAEYQLYTAAINTLRTNATNVITTAANDVTAGGAANTAAAVAGSPPHDDGEDDGGGQQRGSRRLDDGERARQAERRRGMDGRGGGGGGGGRYVDPDADEGYFDVEPLAERRQRQPQYGGDASDGVCGSGGVLRAAATPPARGKDGASVRGGGGGGAAAESPAGSSLSMGSVESMLRAVTALRGPGAHVQGRR